jgi:hypothetical protein
MTALWLVTGAALVAALLAYRRARRTARKLEELTLMYWELRYQYGELRAQRASPGGAGEREAPAPGDGQTPAFVPLTSLRR